MAASGRSYTPQRMISPYGSHSLIRRRWLGAIAGIGWLLLVIAALTEDGGAPGMHLFLLLPAVVIAAFIGGAWPASIIAALATVAVFAASLTPIGTATPGELPPRFAAAVFGALAAAIVASMGLMHHSIEKLRAEQQAAERALMLRQTLFQELRHRIANTVQFTASLLRLQRRQIGESPESARAVLDATINRLEVMSRIHRNLYDSAGLGRGFEDAMRAICEDLLTATDTIGVKCTVESPPLQLPAEKMVCLMLIVTETVINSLKHAFPPGVGGNIAVRGRRLDDGRIELSVRDDGSGLPDGFDPDADGGLGLRLIRSLAQQLGGEFSMTTENGTATRIVFSG